MISCGQSRHGQVNLLPCVLLLFYSDERVQRPFDHFVFARMFTRYFSVSLYANPFGEHHSGSPSSQAAQASNLAKTHLVVSAPRATRFACVINKTVWESWPQTTIFQLLASVRPRIRTDKSTVCTMPTTCLWHTTRYHGLTTKAEIHTAVY